MTMGCAKPMVCRVFRRHSFCGHAVCFVWASAALLLQAAISYRCQHGGGRGRPRAVVAVLREAIHEHVRHAR